MKYWRSVLSWLNSVFSFQSTFFPCLWIMLFFFWWTAVSPTEIGFVAELSNMQTEISSPLNDKAQVRNICLISHHFSPCVQRFPFAAAESPCISFHLSAGPLIVGTFCSLCLIWICLSFFSQFLKCVFNRLQSPPPLQKSITYARKIDRRDVL